MKGQLRVVFKHFPLSFHANARNAAVASIAAYFAPFLLVPTANPSSLPALDPLLLVAPPVDLLSVTPVICLTSFKMPSWLPRFLSTN